VDYIVNVFLTASVVINLVLAHRLYKKKNVLTVDAKHLLHELTTGGAVVKIEVLDTSALFYRSPKG
jgi:hypothetical protein